MERDKKNKRRDSFWRACRYLGPHRWILFISIACAFVVGATFTGGLGTMLPVMQVLINRDSIPDWTNRKIAEDRLGAVLATDARSLRVERIIKPAGEAARHKLERGEELCGGEHGAGVARLLELLADPARQQVTVQVDGASGASRREVELVLKPVPLYLQALGSLAGRVPRDPIKAIAAILVLVVFLAVFGNTVRFFQEYFSEKAAILAVRDIRHRLYDHTLHLRLSFFGQRGTSDVTSRLTQDAQGLQEGMKTLVGSSIQEPIKAAMALGLALFVSWSLTLFIITFAPIMLVLIRKFGKKVRRAARAALQNSSTMLGQIESSLSGVRVVKAWRAEGFERRRFRGIVEGVVREQLRIARLEAFNTPVLELLTLVVVCAIVLYASYLVLVTETVEPSTFFLVMACLMGIGESLRKVSKINNVLQKSNAAAARLFEIMDVEGEGDRTRVVPIKASSGHSGGGNGQAALIVRSARIPLEPMQQDVSFENVTFTYPEAGAPAVSGVSLTVTKGESVAVVGRNGSGKTTLLALLPRFYEPQEGRICIDGIDIRQATLGSLRRQIGIVTQDSVIFPGTIAENIAYALPTAERDEIVEAARRAFAHDFILEKPEGYDTMLGANGLQLSGGQKQRLCIARAILRRTPILILDEATSQVDAESEHLIQQAIEGLMHERTTFVIAHRFSTILSADRIVVMDRGRIVGQGTHQQLLGECPTYQNLYERQLIGVAPATPETASS